MFESITSRFKNVFQAIGKKPAIDAKDLDEVLREIRLVLLEADVALNLVKEIMGQLKEDLLGREIYRSVSPKQVILKTLYDNLFNILKDDEEKIKLYDKPVSYHMLVGLQGTGKTTTAAKIAYYLKNNNKKKVLLVSLDFNRPAAYEQLRVLCDNNQLDFFEYKEKNLDVILPALKEHANKNFYDVVMLDTAGRLNINEELMLEMQDIYNRVKPKEVLLVLDSMIGQISLGVANSFKEKVPLSGVIISKADADGRGGAILSCKYITNVPIKFMGTGEKVNNLEVFNPKRIVDRILDQGDILSLVEKFEEIEEEEVAKLEENISKGIFTLEDMKKQFAQMKKLGGMSGIMGMMPGMSGLKDKLANSGFNEGVIKKHIAIIDSMTKKERKNPAILNFSRKKRIAKGSGTTLQDINILLKQYEQMAKMIKNFKGGGINGAMSALKSMGIGGSGIKDIMKKLK